MTAGVKHDLPYVQTYRDRHGKARYYFRRKGSRRVTLPAPDAPEFLPAYQTALKDEGPVAPSRERKPGTLGALCQQYTGSADFKELAPLTRREMTYVINKLLERHGEKPLDRLQRKHILGWKDALAEQPGAANKLMRTVKQLLSFAVDRGLLEENPALGIKMMKVGEWRAWRDLELEAFEAKWALGTLERTGYALALYTGQRRADLVRLSWASIAGNAFRLKQQKTGAELVIPIHPKLSEALASVHPRREAGILTGEMGRALNPVYFGSIMASAITDAGLSKECVLHGLRKTAARALIDAGCTPHQAAAITGQRTLRMLEHYTRGADQERLARAGMTKWGKDRRRGDNG